MARTQDDFSIDYVGDGCSIDGICGRLVSKGKGGEGEGRRGGGEGKGRRERERERGRGSVPDILIEKGLKA